MAARSSIARVLIGALGTLVGVAVLVVGARGSEIGAGARSPGFLIHGPEETLREYCRLDSNQMLWFELPGGARFELVTSTADPAVLNPGDGEFHPFDEAEVRAALAAVSYPLDRVSAEVFLLPYPRRLGLESAAGPGLILLAPGVRPLSPEHQHSEFDHELGHVVQYALMPDADADGWWTYRRLRDLMDTALYNSTAAHSDRPHEIFAEDFRALFGDPLANYSGTIENSALTPPGQVVGLRDFLAGLAGVAPAPRALAAFPNPGRGPIAFTSGGGAAAPLDLFDVSGRRITTLAPTVFRGGAAWMWDGRDATGRALGPGLVFARVRGERGACVRVTLAR